MTFPNRRRALWLLTLLAGPALASAQDSIVVRPPAVGPPIQRIATASALSTETVGTINSVRELPDGRVLVNDGMRRRLMIMDTTLKLVEVVLDSLSEISNTYGIRPGALISFRGDTTLFVDPASLAVVMIDGNGKIARVRSVWRVQDVTWYTSPSATYGVPGVDAKGRIVYRIPARPEPPKVAPPAGVPWFPQEPDSAFVVGVHFDTRKVDTLGVVRVPRTEMRMRRMVGGGFTVDMVSNPLPATDDWAVLPDGRVAFVRWRDYRIEYLNPDGKITSSEKLPYEWQRMTDELKEKMVDSVRTVQQRQASVSFTTALIRWVNQFGKGYPENFKVPEGYILPPGLAKDAKLPAGVTFPANYMYACPPGEEPTAGALPQMAGERMMMVAGAAGGAPVTVSAPGGVTPPGGAPAGAPRAPTCMPGMLLNTGGFTPPVPTPRPVMVMQAADLPDYKPPLPTGGAVRADADGNLWIRTVPPRPVQGGPVFDIISPQGELVNRLQIPTGYTLVGFGKGKVVYLTMRDQQGIHLARVRLR